MSVVVKMEIKRFETDLMSSNMYLIVEKGYAIVIDPYRNTELGEGLNIDLIILTHEHYDHISGVNLWKEKYHAPVLCSQKCAENIKNPKRNLANHFKEFCELQTWIQLKNVPEFDKDFTCSADITFEDKKTIEWMGHIIKLFETPGHSQGSIGILMDDLYFFSGDSLMRGMNIELRMPGGSRRDWNRIGKMRLDSVPDGITVFPGHNSEFIKGQEEM